MTSPGGGAGSQAQGSDQFSRIWTPHRMDYIRGEGKPAPKQDGSETCPFCEIPAGGDVDGLLVHRGQQAYVVLNLYPYNAGHLLVVPYRHVAGYVDATPDETVEIATLTQTALRVLTQVTGAMGFNIGINQGSIAGAGIAPHLHQHIVPRWGGDTNFMPVVGGTRVLPQLLEQTRDLLAGAWPG